MQAIKLHEKPAPYLGVESYLVPVFDWHTSKIIVNRWMSYLERDGGEEVQSVNYITLVKIPDEHPVSLSYSPILKGFAPQTYAPWSSISLEDKDKACQWIEKLIHSGTTLERHNLPELVLGLPLMQKHVKWTKRIQLLYRREKNIKSKQNALVQSRIH
jgi:hypothetical protein